jgi:excisionase family DNA binding protein
MHMGQEDKALALSAVARRFHVNRKTILRWIKSGKLKGFRTLGGHYRVWSKHLEVFLRKSGIDEEVVLPGEQSSSLIFIIDDDLAYHDPLRLIIEQSFGGAEVHTYDNGYQALIDIGRLRPAVILLDIRMPHIDGFEVMKAIEAMNGGYRPRILVISGYIDPPTERLLSTTIAAARLSKPFTADALVTALIALGIKPAAPPVGESSALSVRDLYRGGE